MKKRRGFTLIELMVVIFIVGVLAAIAIPIFRGRIDAAKNSSIKDTYYAGVDPNQVQAYKDVIALFEEHVYGPLHNATTEDVEKFLKEREGILQQQISDAATIKETLEFERKALMRWVETAAEKKKKHGW